MDDADAPPPGLHHSGLTGGLNRLLSSRRDFPLSPEYGERADGAERSPLTPVKRSKRSAGRDMGRERKERSREGGLQLVRKKAAPVDGERAQRTRRAGREEAEREQRERDRDRESRRHRRRARSPSSSPDRHDDADGDRTARKQRKALEYQRAASAEPAQTNGGRDGAEKALILHPDSTARAELFMSFVNKGPESERGCSVNKALKRYHREMRGEGRGEEEKELWKALRMRRNERGEIVLFF